MYAFMKRNFMKCIVDLNYLSKSLKLSLKKFILLKSNLKQSVQKMNGMN